MSYYNQSYMDDDDDWARPAKYKISNQIEKWDNIKWTNFKNGSSQLKNDMLISKLAQA